MRWFLALAMLALAGCGPEHRECLRWEEQFVEHGGTDLEPTIGMDGHLRFAFVPRRTYYLKEKVCVTYAAPERPTE